MALRKRVGSKHVFTLEIVFPIPVEIHATRPIGPHRQLEASDAMLFLPKAGIHVELWVPAGDFIPATTCAIVGGFP